MTSPSPSKGHLHAPPKAHKDSDQRKSRRVRILRVTPCDRFAISLDQQVVYGLLTHCQHDAAGRGDRCSIDI